MDTEGNVTIIAGNGSCADSETPKVAAGNKINHPTSVAVDPVGNVYFAERIGGGPKYRLRKIDTNGILWGGIGGGGDDYSSDNIPAVDAKIHYIADMAFDRDGNFYLAIADDNNSDTRVRKIDTTGIITTIADDGLSGPEGVTVDKEGNVYFSDTDNGKI